MSKRPQGGHRPRVGTGRQNPHSSKSRTRVNYDRSHNIRDGGGTGTGTAPLPKGEYSSIPGAANQFGTDFEIKMCVLVYLRAVQSNSSFTMTSNDARAGGFDDIVFSYGSPGNEHNILVQLKYSNHPLNLRTPEKKLLNYYFNSMKKTIESQIFENSTYVLLTNADVKLEREVANIDSPAKKLLCTTWRPEDVFQVSLTDDVCKDFKDEIGAEDFVKRLLIFRNQSNLERLDEFIKQELFKIYNGFVPDYRVIQQNFVEKIKAWWGGTTKPPLDEKWTGWIELEKQPFNQIKFCKDTLSDLEKRVQNSECDIILLKCEEAEAQIACSKVYQTFIRKENLRVLFTDISEQKKNLEMLFNLWLDDIWNVLVITDVTNCSQNLGEFITNIKCNLEKKIVIVSSRDGDKLGLSKAHETDPHFIKSSFNQLNDKSQDNLRNILVDFQGKSIALGNIQADKVLDGGCIQSVLTSPKVEIGEALPACEGTYIPRTLSKRLLVKRDILNSNEPVIIGITEKGVSSSMSKAIHEGTLTQQSASDLLHRYNRALNCSKMKKATCEVNCRAEKSPEDPVHFIEMIGNSFYWYRSRGSTDNLFKYIEWLPREEEDCKKLIRDIRSWQPKAEDLVKHEFQTVIVAEEAGCGKTSLLREVANKMKELYPHRWIINIDLNKQSEILDKMRKPDNVTRENILDLLNKSANVDDSELGRKLLEYYVSKSGDICLLFDAFDEIMPKYTDTVLNILKLILNDFGLSTLWVATRYNAKDKLECLLGTKAFRIEPLSEQEQFQYVSKLFGEKVARKFQRQVLNELEESAGVRISSIPLHLKMICQMDPDFTGNLSRVNIINFYEQLIEQKFDVYFREKALINSHSASSDDIREDLRKMFMKRHMICSVIALPEMLEDVDESQKSSITKKVKELCEEIVEGKERLGFIDGVVLGKPHFIHRTFAECFAGKWLAKHWKENKCIVSTISFTYPLRRDIMNKAMCQELASKLPAHLAVLNGDINALRYLKEYLNKRDALGRTPLHLAIMIENKDEEKPLMVLELLKYQPNLNICEYLYAFAPVYYAAQMHCWHIVKILLKHGASVSHLALVFTPTKEFLHALVHGAKPRELEEHERTMLIEALEEVGRSGDYLKINFEDN
ncbi:uncharacterized protein [Anabrus simplex]|uniref:uncharacterized protein n=1 Tax=Anabrus simplex TaxID=316456 RepID=UPI0035A2D6E8